MKTLIVVDMQNDFMPDGALPVKGGYDIIPFINKQLDKYDLVLFSMDWHPRDMKVFEDGTWPEHCIAGEPGSMITDKIDMGKIKNGFYIFKKGLSKLDHPYSVFAAPGFIEFLHKNNVREFDVCGVAGDYCVNETVIDANMSGYNVTVLKDGIAFIDENNRKDIFELYEQSGINIK